jgi:trimethylamine--corrinoid protein Co-methyltransferase
VSDAQLAHEKSLTGLASLLAGASVIFGVGMLESGVTFDLGQVVIDNEIARMMDKFRGGMRVDAESLAVDEIAAIGPGGDFLSSPHTLLHLRDTIVPRLFDRQVRSEWLAAGGRDIAASARATAIQVLAEHRAEPLDNEVAARVRRIVAEADDTDASSSEV